jgi:hypothetical protein
VTDAQGNSVVVCDNGTGMGYEYFYALIQLGYELFHFIILLMFNIDFLIQLV